MFKSLFRSDNPLMIVMSQITDCIFLSLFWLLGCFPVVTAGASFAALYDATYRGFRDGEKNPWQRFFQVFRRNWKQGLGPTAVFLGAGWLLAKALVWLWNGAVAGSLSWVLFSAGAFFGVGGVGILSVLFPLLSRFENSFAGLLKNTLLLSLANLPRTLALGLLNSLTVLACLNWIFPLFFLPSLAALMGSLLIEPMFKPYLPEAAEPQK